MYKVNCLWVSGWKPYVWPFELGNIIVQWFCLFSIFARGKICFFQALHVYFSVLKLSTPGIDLGLTTGTCFMMANVIGTLIQCLKIMLKFIILVLIKFHFKNALPDIIQCIHVGSTYNCLKINKPWPWFKVVRTCLLARLTYLTRDLPSLILALVDWYALWCVQALKKTRLLSVGCKIFDNMSK